MVKENKKSAFKKTEDVLRNYKKYELAIEINSENTILTQNFIHTIELALKSIENDPYYKIIEKIYFNKETRESIAEFYDCDVKTITRNKNRLINHLKTIIFSDDVIKELFL